MDWLLGRTTETGYEQFKFREQTFMTSVFAHNICLLAELLQILIKMFASYNARFVPNISGGFPDLSRTFCGVFSMTFHNLVLVSLTRSMLPSRHTATEHCTHYYVILHLTYRLLRFTNSTKYRLRPKLD